MIHDIRGNVATIFALTLVPVAAAIGAAVDISRIVTAQTHLQAAIDAAALAALAETTPDHRREAVARSAFEASLSEELRQVAPTLAVDISGTAGQRAARIAYTANLPLAFGGLFGVSTMDISGNTEAGVTIGGAMDIALWLDASASMGVAATEAGRDQLRSLSSSDPSLQNCAFACHMPTPLPAPWVNSMQRAHANNIRLRIDVMKENVAMMIEKIREVQVEGQTVRYSIAGLSRTFEPRLALTSDYDAVHAAVDNFTLSGTVHSGGASASRLSPAIGTGTATLPAQGGDGTTDNPRQFVVLVTDGMQFDWENISPGPINVARCEAIKSRGIRLAVVQLRYVSLAGDWAFDYYVAPVYNQIGPALEACASPGMFYAADTPEQIRDAFGELAIRIRGALRLLN